VPLLLQASCSSARKATVREMIGWGELGRCGGVKTNTKSKATFEFNHSFKFSDHSSLNLRYSKKINDIVIHD